MIVIQKKALPLPIVFNGIKNKIMKTVTVSFREDLLRQIDKFAADNVRSRDDIIVEATRIYVEREQKRQALFLYGDRLKSENNFTETDVTDEIKAWRNNK
jgi:predicted transcriptional regulator